MKRFLVAISLVACAALCLIAPGFAAPAAADALSIAGRMKAKLVETRRWFHQHAELSNREVETSAEIARRLRDLGLEVKTGIAHTGISAVVKGALPGPLVAWRADMDALPIDEKDDVPYRSKNPGVMHACGHDVHITVALGAAEALTAMKSRLRGSVKFIFQPAEEGPPAGEEGGAALMIKEGVLEPRPSAIYGLHAMPSYRAGTVAWRSGPVMASAGRFTLRIIGKQSHGAMPQDGVDAVYVASQVVGALQSLVSREQDARKPLVISVGSFHAGSRFNIIAEEAVLEGTVRTLDPAVEARIAKEIERVVAGVTQAHRARYRLDYSMLAPVNANDASLSNTSASVLASTLGKGNVQDWEPAMIAEDFGYYGQKVPSFFFFLGVGNPEAGITAGLHKPEFKVDENSLVTGVAAAVALLTSAR